MVPPPPNNNNNKNNAFLSLICRLRRRQKWIEHRTHPRTIGSYKPSILLLAHAFFCTDLNRMDFSSIILPSYRLSKWALAEFPRPPHLALSPPFPYVGRSRILVQILVGLKQRRNCDKSFEHSLVFGLGQK